MKIKYFAFAWIFVLAISFNAAAQNYDGSWIGTVTESTTTARNCERRSLESINSH